MEKNYIMIENKIKPSTAVENIINNVNNYELIRESCETLDVIIKYYSDIRDMGLKIVQDPKNFIDQYGSDQEVISTCCGKTFKTYVLTSETIELDKDSLNEAEIPDEFYDRSPRLSHKMVKDSFKKILNGKENDFGNILNACHKVSKSSVKTYEVDSTTYKRK